LAHFLANEGCHDATGVVAGGQIGYRWQASAWVFGLEAQGDWADLKGSSTSLVALAPFANRSKIERVRLFTGQIGYAFNNVLFYVKGGAAVVDDSSGATIRSLALHSTATMTPVGAAWLESVWIWLLAELVGRRRIRPLVHGQPHPRLQFDDHAVRFTRRPHQAGRRSCHGARQLSLGRPGRCEVLISAAFERMTKGRPRAGLFVCRCHLPPLQRNRKTIVDDSLTALENGSRSSYVPASLHWRLPRNSRRCAPECGARCVPGNADMDEVLRAKRQQNASAMRAITIRGAREHNLKNIDVDSPRPARWCSPACPAPENPRSLSTPSMPKASAATSSRCRLCAPVPGDDAEA